MEDTIITIIEANPENSTEAVVTTKFPDKVEIVPNLIGNIRAQIEAKNKEIEETKNALDNFLNEQVKSRQKEFEDRIASLTEEKDTLIEKMQSAIEAGIEETTS